MEYKYVEKRVKQENDIVLYGNAVEKDGLWLGIKGVGHERRLDHYEGVVHIFFVQDVAEEEKRGWVSTSFQYI